MKVKKFGLLVAVMACSASLAGLTISKISTTALFPYLPPPLDTQVFGQTRWLANAPVALKIVTMNRQTQRPISAKLKVSVGTKTVFSGMTNFNGIVDVKFRSPSQPGTYPLNIVVKSQIGEDQIEQTVTVEEAAQILLTTDKPIYQPAQTVHIRAICLRKPDLTPAANLPVTFEVRDPKGNLVFRAVERTSRFGIVATQFPIADEVTLGEYRIAATLHGEGSEKRSNQKPLAAAEKTVRVERYVLPKFKVIVETEKRFYLPAETLRGTVNAAYFFGKPVSNGEVTVRLSTFAAGWQDIAELKGMLDEEGIWRFETKLPEKFVGLPLEGGNALLRIEATVTDKAEHSERTSVTLPVSNEPIKIAVVPESANLKPNFPTSLFVVTTYPDGTPAKCKFHVTILSTWSNERLFETEGTTDAMGIGEVSVTLKAAALPRVDRGFGAQAPFVRRRPFLPVEAMGAPDEPILPLMVTVTADDEKGNRAEARRAIAAAAREEGVLLRVDKAFAKVGDTLRLDILAFPHAARTSLPVFVDAIVNHQTVLTKTVDLKNGSGTLTLPLTTDLAGTLVLHAYRITAGGDIVRDTKLVIVEPADALRIAVTSNKSTFRPGETAQIRFSVTDRAGRPTVAALGVTVVDESVFALAEMQPGLERLYFLLEQELLTPRYEVHGWELKPVLLLRDERDGTKDEVKVQRIGRILLAAATPPSSLHTLQVSTYEQKAQKVQERWKQFVQEAAEKIRKALEAYRHSKGTYPHPSEALLELVAANLLAEKHVRDPLGNPLRLEALDNFRAGFRLECAGLDGKFNTDDDIVAFAMGREGREIKVIARNEMVFTDGVVALGLGGFSVRGTILAAPEVLKATAERATGSPTAAEDVRVRQFFPETLFVNPQIVTNERGGAELRFTLADSITTWRLTVLGNSETGQLSSATFPIRVFQDFFVDIDLPVAFTQGDEVSLPVAVYNYLAMPQTVRLKLEANGFDILGEREKTVKLQPNEVTAVRFRLKATKLGTHAITVFAYGEAMSDAVKRTVTVLPDGKELWRTVSDQLSVADGRGKVERILRLSIPHEAIDGASNLFVKVYAGAFTQVLDGLENLLRMPFGCFEQTSSVTYPNVLVLQYLKRTGKAQPETEMKARHFITIGYQRLLTFEVKGGGFSWFGDPPAHKVLTAYGLLEFADMNKVHDIDPNLITRTVNWLISKQNPDGSWEPDKFGIQEGATTRQTDTLRTTAYITWAIGETGRVLDEGQVKTALRKAIGYLSEHINGADEAYALALMLNAFIGAKELLDSSQHQNLSTLIDRISQRLSSMAKESTEEAYWESKSPTPFYGRGQSGDLETTALATYGLIRHGGYATLVNKALTYLVRRKDAFGTWQTTQATIWSLKALLAAMEKGTSEINGTLVVRVNGEEVAKWHITPENADIVRTVDSSRLVREGGNEIELAFNGKGILLYQVSARFYLPWQLVPPAPEEPLQVQVHYDRTELQTNETVTCQISVRNRRPAASQMVIVDIGIPPGFEVLTDDLTNLVERKVLSKFELTPRQVICYLDRIEGGAVVEWRFRLRAKMPVRAKTGRTTAYEYYAPQEAGITAPITLTAQ
ncbi:MAG: MG2 domain-containing protein [Candidatus Fervidibacter sp.]|uniref:MG2 domain-containing protein n=1 Tax=Candidatus Fervidibacter sp. TaxID=3100871 RepID=UPI0040497497